LVVGAVVPPITDSRHDFLRVQGALILRLMIILICGVCAHFYWK
jgi:hypothetical protein